MPAHQRRLLDVLNDPGTDYLHLNRAQVFRRGCGSCAGTLPAAVIHKANIGLAVPSTDRHEAPLERCRRFVSKDRYPAFLLVLGYEIRGEVSLTGAADPVAALCHELPGFFPVANGTISFAGSSSAQQESQVVIVNKSFVSLLQIMEAATAKAGASAS